jgi:hypothetical protein
VLRKLLGDIEDEINTLSCSLFLGGGWMSTWMIYELTNHILHVVYRKAELAEDLYYHTRIGQGLSLTSTADRRVDESGSLAYERHWEGNLGLLKDECRKSCFRREEEKRERRSLGW